MRKFVIFILIIFFSNVACSQAIRKNHLEMTTNERIDLVNAFYQLRLGPDLINDISQFHADFFNFDQTETPDALDIHFNLPGEPEREIFLAWHRRQIFEVEQAMQDINPNISMPYWDSSVDQSENSTLWDLNFMGQFDIDWSLNRFFGNLTSLPEAQDIDDLMLETDFFTFSNQFERGRPHTGAHQWVGGVMPTIFSASDPVFYLHHTNVDRIWKEWEDIHQSSSYLTTSMLRYDGTYVFDGQILPLVNPNDITSEKAYGTFYASNQLAVLEDYVVSNTYNSLENFYYQHTIQAGNNFIIPSGTDCKFESVNEILLQPGFEVANGGSFLATIDDQSASRSLPIKDNTIVRNQIPFGEIELENAFANQTLEDFITVLKSFPNPFTDKITILLNRKLEQTRVTIFDVLGKQIKEQTFYNTNKIEIINLSNLAKGIYVVKIFDKDENTLNVRRLIKI